ncbi:monodehydroascorbate reductase [Tanacetum coccineum]
MEQVIVSALVQEHLDMEVNKAQEVMHAIFASDQGRDIKTYDYLPFFYSRSFDLSWKFYGDNVGDTVIFGGAAEENLAIAQVAKAQPPASSLKVLATKGLEFASLSTLDISSNSFTGDLPQSFTSLSSPADMYLQNNQFTGTTNDCNSWNAGPAPPSPPGTPIAAGRGRQNWQPRGNNPSTDGGGSSDNGKKSGIGGGAIAGIMISILVVAALIAFFFIKKRSKKSSINIEKTEDQILLFSVDYFVHHLDLRLYKSCVVYDTKSAKSVATKYFGYVVSLISGSVAYLRYVLEKAVGVRRNWLDMIIMYLREFVDEHWDFALSVDRLLHDMLFWSC